MAELPFDVMLLFSTNLPPEHLADEAFLRRIRYKIRIDNPTADEYRAIFRRECDARRVRCDEAALDRLIEFWYRDGVREMRGCHPRDLLDAVFDLAGASADAPPQLTTDLLDEACAAYFL